SQGGLGLGWDVFPKSEERTDQDWQQHTHPPPPLCSFPLLFSSSYQAAKEDMAPGWDMFPKSEERTDQDWQHSVFCICPPGHSQWTSRPFKALISGCISVTFFRKHDNPWQRSLNYDSFSINIDHDDVPSIRARLEQADVPRLQKGVDKVQVRASESSCR
ncbi:unnamed protein product, partial [Closterium sp. NIES-54]